MFNVVASRTCGELEAAMRCEQLTEELTDRLEAELESYGVSVIRAFFSDLTRCSAVRVYGEPTNNAVPLETIQETQQ